MQTYAKNNRPNQKIFETRESEVTPESNGIKIKKFKAIEADYNNQSLFLNF